MQVDFYKGPPSAGRWRHLFALGVLLASQTLNQRDELGVPGVAQEGSRVVSQGALAALSGNTYVVECFFVSTVFGEGLVQEGRDETEEAAPIPRPIFFPGRCLERSVWMGTRFQKKRAFWARETFLYLMRMKYNLTSPHRIKYVKSVAFTNISRRALSNSRSHRISGLRDETSRTRRAAPTKDNPSTPKGQGQPQGESGLAQQMPKNPPKGGGGLLQKINLIRTLTGQSCP